MSYIIQQNQPFINFKLTETGREKLAQGQLTFGFWAIGDSEINYDRELYNDTVVNNPTLGSSGVILNSVDKQPEIKYFLTRNQITDVNGELDNLNVLSENNIRTLKYIVNNRATSRGFFETSDNISYSQNTNSNILLQTSTTTLNGTDTIPLASTNDLEVGNFILIKIGGSSGNNNVLPVPYLWYRIVNIIGLSVQLDREVPSGNLLATYFVYKNGEVANSFGNSNVTSYWDSDTLNFNSSCDISVTDVPVWNMNNVWDENFAGLSGSTVEKFEQFGSYNYIGSKNPYLGYDIQNDPVDIKNCDTNSVFDDTVKGIGIIHYTNNTISNFYGEFFFIDNDNNKTVQLTLPTLMYHRRKFSGSGTGDLVGMKFIASDEKGVIENSNIDFHYLIEEPTMVNGTPLKVGRVFPQYKIIVIDDEELLAAMSYKSNRNWTLPKIDLNLVNSSEGILPQNKTMYVTYMLHNDDTVDLKGGNLPHQKYVKVTNTTSLPKDVDILLEDIDLLPYMRKIESSDYDDLGFYANKFKVLYQIIDDVDDRPDPEKWLEVDLTSNLLTGGDGETIDPKVLESKNANSTGLKLNRFTISDEIPFNLSNYLNMSLINQNGDNLQFGDERFLYGNVDTFIGATVFKTLFDINISSTNFRSSNNPTKEDNPDSNIKISEMGIYDENRNLVGIAKLSIPVELQNGTTITLEASIDF